MRLARVLAILVLAIGPQMASAQDPAGKATQSARASGPEEKAKAVVVRQDGDDLLLLLHVGGTTETRSFHVTPATKAAGLNADWKVMSHKSGTSKFALYDLEGKSAEVTFRGGTLTAMAMQTACKKDFRPVKDCARKCGAKPCTCSGQ